MKYAGYAVLAVWAGMIVIIVGLTALLTSLHAGAVNTAVAVGGTCAVYVIATAIFFGLRARRRLQGEHGAEEQPTAEPPIQRQRLTPGHRIFFRLVAVGEMLLATVLFFGKDVLTPAIPLGAVVGIIAILVLSAFAVAVLTLRK